MTIPPNAPGRESRLAIENRTKAGAKTFNRMPSSVIHDFDYDADAQELTIWFKTGRIYLYFAVPEEVYAALSGAYSNGTYFNRHIRDHYKFHELTPTGEAPS